jgi:DNA-binding MarR family transcriptional regulator
MYQRDNLTMGELSKAIAVPMSTATGMIDWMVDNGYVKRLSDPEDRRVVRISLTHSGRSLYESLQDHMVQHLQQLLSCLTFEEQSSMSSILRKIATAVREAEE